MSFFKKYPTITYNNHLMRNIILKSQIVQEVFERFEVFYPYIIEDGERPDTISYDYYGDSDYWWVILMANKIVDPYYEWPLTHSELKGYIIKKYGSIPEAKSDIKHYVYTGIGGEDENEIARKSWIMPVETFTNLGAEEKSGWTPIYSYDYEETVNDEKRSIQILDRNYISQINNDLKSIFNDR